MPTPESAPFAAASFARAGFVDAKTSAQWAKDAALAPLMGDEPWRHDGFLTAVAAAPDPDMALKAVVRALGTHPEPAEVLSWLADEDPRRDLVLGLLGSSSALGAFIAGRGHRWRPTIPASVTVGDVRDTVLAALTGCDDLPLADRLRIAYRQAVTNIAAWDVFHPQPETIVHAVGELLAEAAGAALEVAYVAAAQEVPDAHVCRFAVIALGKCGGLELNYISDVDVMFVVAPTTGGCEESAVATGKALAAAMIRICGATTPYGSLWQLDAALRPEGKNGPLVRTLDSYVEYYSRWAKTWEYQALLKARTVAGDAALGEQFCDRTAQYVWQAASRDNFVDDVHAMRRRVERHIPAGDASRQIKLGQGGLRDIEFCVQLVQLVHGRHDQSVRQRATLPALAALSRGAYVGREDAEGFAECYRFLRLLEHRNQLYRMQRTHLLPTGENDLRRLARGLKLGTADNLLEKWKNTRTDVRGVHEKLFYRPVLAAVSKLTTEEARLDPTAAQSRLQALGFHDAKAALAAVEHLSSGSTRRAQIQRHILPALLGWFAQTADADRTLKDFRRLSDQIGTSHWYLGLLRDSEALAERLVSVLGSGQYIPERLMVNEQAVQWLHDDSDLLPPSEARLAATFGQVLNRETGAAAIPLLRKKFRNERLRLALGLLGGVVDRSQVGDALTRATQVLLDTALVALTTPDASGQVLGDRSQVAIIGMGRFGGREQSFASDADIIVVHEAAATMTAEQAAAGAINVATALRRELANKPGEPIIGLDLDLRPEGKTGPLSRSVQACTDYYHRWGETWHRQALLRAAPVAGDLAVAEKFLTAIASFRYPDGGVDASEIKQIRRLKARMESERLPMGVNAKRHVKLGPGGLTDIEWVAQMLQLQHAYNLPEMQVTGTLDALEAARKHKLLTEDEAELLCQTWLHLSYLRDAITMWSNKSGDVMPPTIKDWEGVARIMGYPAGEGQQLHEDTLRAMRRARAVTEPRIYGS